jgi:hypothetical protein
MMYGADGENGEEEGYNAYDDDEDEEEEGGDIEAGAASEDEDSDDEDTANMDHSAQG